MRHSVYGKHLGRDKNQRNALFKNLVRSLFLWEKIETTEVKAKSIRGLVDKLVNSAKNPNTKRLVAQFLIDKKVSEKLIKDLAPRLKERNSGYTSITKLGRRLGDGAMVVEMRLLTDEKTKEESGVPLSPRSESSKSQESGDNKTKVKTQPVRSSRSNTKEKVGKKKENPRL